MACFQVSVPIISNRRCEGMYRRAGLPQEIPDIFFCAGKEDGGIDSCNVRKVIFLDMACL